MLLTPEHKTRSKKDSPFSPQWASLLKQKRTELGESQQTFGHRFGVRVATVSHWETGRREAPYKVTWWLYMQERRGGK